MKRTIGIKFCYYSGIMTTSIRIVAALKRELKARGITYRVLADLLELSESAVKHMFSTGNFSIRRLDEICAALELDIGDLVRLSESQETAYRGADG